MKEYYHPEENPKNPSKLSQIKKLPTSKPKKPFYADRREISIYGLVLGVIMLAASIILNQAAKNLLPRIAYGNTGTEFYLEYGKCYSLFNIIITIASVLVITGALWKGVFPGKSAFFGAAMVFLIFAAFAHNSTIDMNFDEQTVIVAYFSRWLFDIPFFLIIPLFFRRLLLALWDKLRNRA